MYGEIIILQHSSHGLAALVPGYPGAEFYMLTCLEH